MLLNHTTRATGSADVTLAKETARFPFPNLRLL